MADRVGQQLGNYRLISLLGQGGFADVYLGQHLHLDSQAAIKIMHTHLAQEEWEGFRKEARIVAGLMHPHIVRLLDFDVEDGIPFLVMQFAPNGTLRRRHPAGQPLVPAIILPYVRQVADALHYIHGRKLIHRDIKPENMLLGPENEVLLSDFGVAIIAQSSRQENTQNIGGTVAYMAPEQIQSKPCPASDQYALGVVVYEWLTGDRPFGGSFTEIATKHILVAPPPLRALAPTLSLSIEEVVLRALAKEPQQRFPNVQAFAQALEEAISALGASATVIDQRPTLISSAITIAKDSSADNSLTTRALISSPHLSAPDVTAPTESPRRGITRRTVLLGLAGLAASGGVLAWMALNHQSPTQSQIAQASTKPTPTPPPPAGTTLHNFWYDPYPVYAVAWSPDGSKIASAGRDKKVLIWDVKKGVPTFIFTGHKGYVNAVSWSPDGSKIASGSDDMTVLVWDAATGAVLRTYTGHQSVVGTLAWSPDGLSIASGSGDIYEDLDHTVQVWDVQTRQLLFPPYTGHGSQIKQVAWSPDKTRIASASTDKTVQVWSATDGSYIYTYQGHTDEVWGVAWSPDSKQLVSGSHDGTVRVWEPKPGGSEIVYKSHTDEVNAVAWSPDGTMIASGSGYTQHQRASYDTTVQVWNTAYAPTAIPLVYSHHTDVVEAVAWSPDSTRIASASDDFTVQVWEAV
ncbi:MAG TPA: serine/threonine-protein kinase [Ktedonobacterales bacterium]|nr:serine/threonine-protein kinase [Ktedonobacterales bacterium]